MIPVPLWTLLSALIVWFATMGGSYLFGRSDGRNLEVASQAKAEEIVKQATEAANKSTAEAISKIEVKHVTVRQEIQTRVQNNPVYRDCIHDDGVFSRINEALTGRTSGDSKLPAPQPAKR